MVAQKRLDVLDATFRAATLAMQQKCVVEAHEVPSGSQAEPSVKRKQQSLRG
jgi:hypothetical protein